MAATFSTSEIILLLFIINFSFSPFYLCTASSTYTWRPIFSPFAERDFLYLKLVAGHSGHSNLNAGTHGRIFRRHSPRRPISTYYKHGFICMYLPMKDLTICVDVQSNPGPVSPRATKPPFSNFGGNCRHAVNTNLHVTVSHQDKAVVSYNRLQLMNVRILRHCSPTSALLTTLKEHNVLRFRGRRAGKHKIPTRITVNSPTYLHINRYKNRVVNRANLTIVPVSRSSMPALDSTMVTVSRPFNVATINCESCNNKTADLVDYVIEKDLEVCCLTETWLREDNSLTPLHLCPVGYNICSFPRQCRIGGGVAVVYKDTLLLKQIETASSSSFEHGVVELSHPQFSRSLVLAIVYRPPRSRVNNTAMSVFLNEMTYFLTSLAVRPGELLVTGDFNIHVDDTNDPNSRRFLDILDSLNLVQHVTEPTHKAGHTLDLVMYSQGWWYLKF